MSVTAVVTVLWYCGSLFSQSALLLFFGQDERVLADVYLKISTGPGNSHVES